MENHIKIYFMAENAMSLRGWIYWFDLEYRKYHMGVESELEQMLLSFREAFEDKCVSVFCSEFGEQYFDIIQYNLDAVDYAAKSRDYTTVYDILNGAILPNIIKLLCQIFQQYKDEISKHFWSENKAALEERYPEVKEKIEHLSEDERIGVREYGSRGKVVYKKNGEMEYDLYSAYHPIDAGERMTEMIFAVRYCKIYMWGCNGGFEVNGFIHDFSCENVVVEIYVKDLCEFACILRNTKRKGAILNSKIHWHFETGLKEFLRDFLTDKEKEMNYLYVSGFCDEDRRTIKEFVVNHSINSNV